MGIITIIVVGIALSFDTFAVSIGCGIAECRIRFWQAVRIAGFFAVFQALMPVLGWILGGLFKEYVANFDHWIAFGLLTIIGLKMILESFKSEEAKQFNPHKLSVIITMSLATTIDAFIVGISFAIIQINMFLAISIIGFITFLAAMLGMLFGKKIGGKVGAKAEVVGGVVLIIIGLKILLDHLI